MEIFSLLLRLSELRLVSQAHILDVKMRLSWQMTNIGLNIFFRGLMMLTHPSPSLTLKAWSSLIFSFYPTFLNFEDILDYVLLGSIFHHKILNFLIIFGIKILDAILIDDS